MHTIRFRISQNDKITDFENPKTIPWYPFLFKSLHRNKIDMAIYIYILYIYIYIYVSPPSLHSRSTSPGGPLGPQNRGKVTKSAKSMFKKNQARHFIRKKSPCGTQLAHDKVVNRDKNGNDAFQHHSQPFRTIYTVN